MARRPTIQDIAREAGVSVATVDRVLNGRLRVREETARKVSDAAHRVGYHATNLIEQRLRADFPEVRMGFVLQKERHAFYQRFASQLEDVVSKAPGIRGKAIIEFAPTQAPSDMAKIIDSLANRVDALAAVAVNHISVTDAILRLRSKGIATFAALNDFAQGERLCYIGTNNIKVGRIAGWMVSSVVHEPGKVALFVGGHRWHGHELRETGFRSFFREKAPGFTILDTMVNLETRQLTYEATLDLLDRHPDTKGIYITGGGMEGAMRALRENRAPGDVALVVNELTPETQRGLSDGYVTMVVSTPMNTLCAQLVDMMAQSVLNDEARIPSQIFLESLIHLPESV